MASDGVDALKKLPEGKFDLMLTDIKMPGGDGIERDLECGEPVNRNVWDMSQRERKRLKIHQLPASLDEAIALLPSRRGAAPGSMTAIVPPRAPTA